MSGSQAVKALESRLDGILQILLRRVEGSGCTLRIDDVQRGWNVDFVCAEAVLPDVKSLRGDGSIDQRAADTVKWLAQHKRLLVQPDITGDADPKPPAALMSAYAAKAQMLAPLLNTEGGLDGWLSVQYTDEPRSHPVEDQQVMRTV